MNRSTQKDSVCASSPQFRTRGAKEPQDSFSGWVHAASSLGGPEKPFPLRGGGEERGEGSRGRLALRLLPLWALGGGPPGRGGSTHRREFQTSDFAHPPECFFE